MLLNLTVVYFALGAPLGVYGVIRNRGTSPQDLALSLVRFVFWPLFAAVSVREAFVFQPAQETLEQKVDALRTEFEAEIDRRSLFEFRDIFARYTGLGMAAANAGDDTYARELLKVAGRRDAGTASACLARRNRRRLEFHLLQARNEFTELISQNSTPRAGELNSRLAKLLNDIDL